VTCTSSSNCWAVGYYRDSTSNAQTLTEQYNGTSWAVVTSPNHSTTADHVIYNPICVSASDCYAEGYYLGSSVNQTLVIHWNGSAWSFVTSADWSTSQGETVARSMGCLSTSDCWIAGYIIDANGYYQSMAQHWNGTSWTIPSNSQLPVGGSQDLWGSAAKSAGFGWGWASDVGMSIAAGSGTEIVTDESGAPVTCSGSGSTWTCPAYNAATLTTSGGNWTYKRWNGDTFNFNSSGQLTSEVDRNSNTTSYAYVSGKLSTETDPGSRTIQFTWTGSNITQAKDPVNQTVGYSYDAFGNLTQVTDQAGNHVSYTYDGNHQLLTETDKNGNATTYAYSPTGQLVTQTDAMSRQTTYAYSVPGSNQNATLVTGGAGDEEQYTFTYNLLTKKVSAYGQSYATTATYLHDPTILGVYAETDVLGTNTYNIYDSQGNLTSAVATPASGTGSTTSATYNSLNEPLTQIDANGNTTTNAYDNNGNVCWTLAGTSSNACGSIPSSATSYAYADATNPGLATTVTDEKGNATTKTYDSYGNLATSTIGGNQTSYTYNSVGNKLTEVPPAGNKSGCDATCKANNTTTYTYDALNDVLTTQAPNPTGSGFATTTNTYDYESHLLTSQDPKGNWTTKIYNADGEECWTYVAASTSSNNCATPPAGATSQTYDNDGRVHQSFDAKGTVTTYTYNDLGQTVSEVTGATTSYTYDSNGNVLTKTSPNGNTCTPQPSCQATYTTTYTYDYANRVLTTTDENGHTTTNTYDSNGNLLTVTDPTGNITTNTYNAQNQLCWTYISTSGSANDCAHPPTGAMQKSFDDAGNLHTVTDGNGTITTNTYDTENRLCWTYVSSTPSSNTCGSPPSGMTTSFTYDDNGNVLTKKLPNANIISNAYNAANQLCWSYVNTSTSTAACSSPPSGAVTYQYDADGHRTQMVDGTGTSTWGYNTLSQEVSYTNGAGRQVQFTPDANGNQTATKYPDGTILSQAFDSNSRACWSYMSTSTSTAACASPPSGAITYTFDDNGNLKSEALPNGVTNSYTFDGTNSVTAISDAKSGTTVFSANYTRNADNLITNDTSQPSNYGTYKYTAKNELCYAAATSTPACSSPPSPSYPYAYDYAGNATNNNGLTQQYNSTDELCWSATSTTTPACGSPPSGATTYNFNTNGDRTSSVPPSGPATCFSYDGRDELTSVVTGTGSSCTSPTTLGSYTYDGNGLRMSKTANSTTTASSWQDVGALPLMLQENGGTGVTKYVYGPTGNVLEQVTPGGATFYYSYNSLGSVRAITNSTGTSVATFHLRPGREGDCLHGCDRDGQRQQHLYWLDCGIRPFAVRRAVPR
jgi:YD repeat-containing protein